MQSSQNSSHEEEFILAFVHESWHTSWHAELMNHGLPLGGIPWLVNMCMT